MAGTGRPFIVGGILDQRFFTVNTGEVLDKLLDDKLVLDDDD